MVFHAISSNERLVTLHQCSLVAFGICDVGKGKQHGAVRKRHRRVVDDRIVWPHHLAIERFAFDGKRCNGPADTRPRWRIVIKLARLCDDFVDVRRFSKSAPRKLPYGGKCRVVELQSAVGCKHRDAFLEAVERFALHVAQGTVISFERKPLRLIDVQVGDAAVGALLGHEVKRAAVRPMPPVLVASGRSITR